LLFKTHKDQRWNRENQSGTPFRFLNSSSLKSITTRSIPKFKRQENNKTERKLKLRKHRSPYIIDDQNK